MTVPEPRSPVILMCGECRRKFTVPQPGRFDYLCPGCGRYLRSFVCLRCGHTWSPRERSRLPRVCPVCKSPYWDRERTMVYREGVRPGLKGGRA